MPEDTVPKPYHFTSLSTLDLDVDGSQEADHIVHWDSSPVETVSLESDLSETARFCLPLENSTLSSLSSFRLPVPRPPPKRIPLDLALTMPVSPYPGRSSSPSEPSASTRSRMSSADGAVMAR